MMNVSRSRLCAFVSLIAIAVLSLGLGLGLGVGLKTSASTVCSALADAVAANLDQGLNEHKEAFEQQLQAAGLPRLKVVEVQPTTVDEAACAQPTHTLAVAFEFSLDGEVEGLLSSDAEQAKMRAALAAQVGLRPEDVSLSVVAGSATVLGYIRARYFALSEARYFPPFETWSFSSSDWASRWANFQRDLRNWFSRMD